MNFSINDQELQSKTQSKEKLIFKGENGQLYEIIPYDGGTEDVGLSE